MLQLLSRTYLALNWLLFIYAFVAIDVNVNMVCGNNPSKRRPPPLVAAVARAVYVTVSIKLECNNIVTAPKRAA